MTPQATLLRLAERTNRMKKKRVEKYYVSRQPQLLRQFDKTAEHVQKAMIPRYGEEMTGAILQQARKEYQDLIPSLPYIGGRKNFMTRNLVSMAAVLALYQALKGEGVVVEQVGEIIYRAFGSQLDAYPRAFLRLIGWLGFTAPFLQGMRRGAKESQKRTYPGDWVYTFVEGDGVEFDYGLDYTECAICKLFHAHDADELVPYLCVADFAHSRAFDTGLVRTMTLAEGGDRCDFRYKRGREVKQGWPPGFLKEAGR
jgi:hypothetical protein